MKHRLIAFAALAALGSSSAFAQAVNTADETELLVSQIQTDKRAVVLESMDLTDTEVAAFTTIYDKYQADTKGQFEELRQLLNKFAANYGSMTDDAAKDILKDFFKLRDARNSTLKKYAKQMARVLPETKVLRWVQIENKLNALLDVQAARIIPVSL
jgi:Spy/CpxP family protein refolding chaperone